MYTIKNFIINPNADLYRRILSNTIQFIRSNSYKLTANAIENLTFSLNFVQFIFLTILFDFRRKIIILFSTIFANIKI